MDKKQADIESFFLQNIPFVCYHLPNSDEIILLFCSLENGLNSENKLSFIIKYWTGATIMLHGIKLFKITITELDNLKIKLNLRSFTEYTSSKEEFKQFVDQIKEAIKSEKYTKIVASRIKKVILKDNKSLFHILKNIIHSYPSAFSYLLYLPDNKICWMGASPEILLRHEGNIVKTMSLAGTQKFADNINWGEKEKVEQQIVTDYISESIKAFGYQIEISPADTKRAGNLAHLCSEIKVKIPDNYAVQKIADSLHPTPAVAGIPKEKSIKFINENEGYNRSLYTGYLGVKNTNGTHYFVNLRCMQIFNDFAAVYVGAGITIDSDAEKEWKETELKSMTMINIINKSTEIDK